MLEVTLFDRAYELAGDLVSGNYILVNETKSKDDPCWKKDDDDLFIYQSMESFQVLLWKTYRVNYKRYHFTVFDLRHLHWF